MERYAEKQQQGEDRASRLSPEHPAGVAAPFSQHLIPDHPAPTSLNELHPGRHDHPSVPHEHDPAPREHDAAPHDRAPAPHEHAPAPHAHAPVHVRNRRREYLDRNPAYFDSVEHELADPVLYDKLVRRFQTPAEREADDAAKGYGHVMEAALRRGEAKAALTQASAGRAVDGPSYGGASLLQQGRGHMPRPEAEWADLSTPPSDKADGVGQWRAYLRARFVRGGDTDFDYEAVDENDEYDALARRDAEEAWFEDEEPEWATAGELEEAGQDTERQTGAGLELHGETGVQDF